MPTQPATALEVVADLPLSPILVIASDTLALVETFRHAVGEVAIRDAASAAHAASLLRSITDCASALESRRKEVKQPFLDAERKIDAAVRAPAAALETARTALRRKLAAWQIEQDRVARETERRRQAEIARLEQERREAEERARQAQAAASVSDSLDEFGADEVAAEQKSAEIAQRQAALAVARAEVPAAPAGISYRTLLKFEVVDVRQLPSHLVTVTPNDAAIRAQFCNGYREGQPLPVQPGIRFVVEKLPVMSARR